MIFRWFRMAKATTSFRTFKRYRTIYNRSIYFLFKKNLFLTNSLSSGGFMVLGDLITQEYEYQTEQLPQRYDWARMKRMFIIGTLLGAGHHYYYLYLDVLLPKSDVRTVLKKVAADQAICSPITLVIFLYGVARLEEKTHKESTKELGNKFWIIYLGDWLFWPPIQAFNFYFLPSQYRVLYINIATMVFDIFLSLVKHYDQH